MIDISKEDFGALCICALRYCQGRKTYMPSHIQGIVSAHFDDLTEKDLKVITEDRVSQQRFGLWGSDIDKADWDKFYARLQAYINKSAAEAANEEN